MNNDAPETLAAARSRAADLEQQLKLSDEGVSRLAQRCLELEQQVLNYQAALARHGSDNEPAALTLPQLFYDSGSGYSPRECLTVAEDAYDELTHEVSAVFTLPTDARALRLDPGELACCVTDLSISDERLECRAMNGIYISSRISGLSTKLLRPLVRTVRNPVSTVAAMLFFCWMYMSKLEVMPLVR